jgi:SAM-dependent methyltransferase
VAELIGAVAVDVGAFRKARVPYVVYDGRRLPFADGSFDMVVVLLTLHHCAEPERVMDEAIRVARGRVLVTESVYRNALDLWWLRRLDHRLNGWRHGGAMPGPFRFRRAEEWAEVLRRPGVAVGPPRWLGSWWERLVHHPVLFVLERTGAPARAYGKTDGTRCSCGTRGRP